MASNHSTPQKRTPFLGARVISFSLLHSGGLQSRRFWRCAPARPMEKSCAVRTAVAGRAWRQQAAKASRSQLREETEGAKSVRQVSLAANDTSIDAVLELPKISSSSSSGWRRQEKPVLLASRPLQLEQQALPSLDRSSSSRISQSAEQSVKVVA